MQQQQQQQQQQNKTESDDSEDAELEERRKRRARIEAKVIENSDDIEMSDLEAAEAEAKEIEDEMNGVHQSFYFPSFFLYYSFSLMTISPFKNSCSRE